MSAEGEDDPGDLAGLCAQLRPQLVGALTLHTGDRAVAEELAQETLVRLWQRWPRVRRLDSPQGGATGWRPTSPGRGGGAAPPSGAPTGGLDADRGRPAPTGPDDVVALREAVAGLPRRQREALVLRHYLQLPAERAAQAMGCAAGTVRALCRQGLDRLRQQGVVAETEPQEASDG